MTSELCQILVVALRRYWCLENGAGFSTLLPILVLIALKLVAVGIL